MRQWLLLIAVAAMCCSSASGLAFASDETDAEVKAWSDAFASWVDVSHNIACPALQPRIDGLTKHLGDVPDVFLARHPDYVFPPMIYATRPFVDCGSGATLLAKAEARATLVDKMVRNPR